MPKKPPKDASRLPKTDDKAKLISEQAKQIDEFADTALAAAQELRIKTKPLKNFSLAPAQRDLLLLVPGVTRSLKAKLADTSSAFTVAEIANMTKALAEDLPRGDARSQVAVLLVAKHLMDHLQSGISAEATPKLTKKPKSKSKATDALYQFKITLLESQPPIWRRIQVKDCTLDKLHEHIQTAMGWTNSHLHKFEINGQRYGDLELLDDDFEPFTGVDSTITMLSDVLPKSGKTFRFTYEYDFGDSWDHKVAFEGCPPIDPKTKYPICLEGKRACPPEDVGGVGGYEEFLAAIVDPKHEEHKNLLSWCGGKFSPDEFDPTRATKEMRKGLPDWRSMDDDF